MWYENKTINFIIGFMVFWLCLLILTGSTILLYAFSVLVFGKWL